MQTQLELSADLGYLDQEQVWKLMGQGAEVARLINGLLASMGRGKRTQEPGADSANTANSAREDTEQ